MILPGSTLGILGGGQLGRMIAIAARPMGYRVIVLDPNPNCAAKPVVDEVIVGDFNDVGAARQLAERADVATIEIEKISVDVLNAVSAQIPLRPGPAAVSMIRDRGKQKQWLADHQLPLAPWALAESEQDVFEALVAMPGHCFIKSCTGGYDGRGQVEVNEPKQAETAWQTLGGESVVVEQAIPLDHELSVLVARRPSGEVVTYAPARNHHENRILAWSAWPAATDADLVPEAQALAKRIAEALKLEGVLVVELFVTPSKKLLVNELAPRVHNSYHASERAAVTDQFEQAVRAACDLPLGRPDALAHAAIVNLLGDLWLADEPPAWEKALAIPTVCLHDYGKGQARPGRKMGHLSATGASVKEAVERARKGLAALAR